MCDALDSWSDTIKAFSGLMLNRDIINRKLFHFKIKLCEKLTWEIADFHRKTAVQRYWYMKRVVMINLMINFFKLFYIVISFIGRSQRSRHSCSFHTLALLWIGKKHFERLTDFKFHWFPDIAGSFSDVCLQKPT